MKTVKKLLSHLVSALPHLNIALGLVMLALLVTDSFNRAMNFINNDITKTLLAFFCLLVIIESMIYSHIRRSGK